MTHPDQPFDPKKLLTMVGVLRQAITRPVDRTALARAQEIMCNARAAWGAAQEERARALAIEALGTSPHCSEAYVLLGSHAVPDPDDALTIIELAVAAGERALGTDLGAGEWDSEEGRAYLRARLRLADGLWFVGRPDESVAQYEALLELDPDDSQGAHYMFLHVLLELGRDDHLVDLVERYSEDESTEWTYTRLLARLRVGSDASTLAELLSTAAESNRHVPDFLLGNTPMLDDWPEFDVAGSPDEAAEYVDTFADLWSRTKGALAWLAREWPKVKPAG